MASPGGNRIPTRVLTGIAGFCALWCLLFLGGSPAPSYFAVPLVLIGVITLRTHPVAGALVVLLANVVTLFAGVPYGSVDMMAAFAFTLFSVGRMVGNRLTGLSITTAAAVTTAARPPFEPLDLLVSGAVLGSMWLFGVIVRRRARSAWQAVAELEHLAAEDAGTYAAGRLAEEHHRLATEVLGSLRRAVSDMQSMAIQSLSGRNPAAAERIQRRGTEAVAELRALLGLLRTPESPTPSPKQGDPGRAYRDAAWLAAYCLTLAWTAVAVIRPPAEPQLLLPLAALGAVLCWTVVTRPSTTRWTLLALLAALMAALSLRFGLQAIGFVFVVYATDALAGQTWGERDRITVAALRDSAVMQRRRDVLAAEAVRMERLRVARELHDVTSHAVGVMVLQAGAAQALATSAPERAVAALRQVHAAGADALTEIDELLGVLAGEADGARDLRASLGQLRDSLGELGLVVTLALRTMPDRAPDSAVLSETIHRVVREGLTNVLRHAPGARARVEVDRDGSEWVVRVVNDSPPDPTPDTPGSGYGLTGMAERVAAHGGTLTSGPTPEGGYVVEARMPTRGDQAS